MKIHITHPIQRTRKEKADIQIYNYEVLGKGERERENRFYKIGFPLAEKKVNPKKSPRGTTDFFPKAVSPSDNKKSKH